MSGSGLKVGSLFITGANRGIGLEFVKQLTQLPQPPKHIFATCRNPDAAEVLCCMRRGDVIWSVLAIDDIHSNCAFDVRMQPRCATDMQVD